MIRILSSAALVLSLCMAALAQSPARENVSFTTYDNVTIAATFVKGKAPRGPAVLLVHMLGRTRADWDPILDKYLLPQTPYSYLAIDLRGHGDSTARDGKKISFNNFTSKDWQDIVKDVEAAVKYLRGRNDVDPDKIAIIGASIGANAAINYAARDPKIPAVALLSPGGDYHGLDSTVAMTNYGERPVFMAVSSDDGYAYQSVIGPLSLNAKGKKVTRIFDGTLHGTRMFGIVPVDKPLISFLTEYLGK